MPNRALQYKRSIIQVYYLHCCQIAVLDGSSRPPRCQPCAQPKWCTAFISACCPRSLCSGRQRQNRGYCDKSPWLKVGNAGAVSQCLLIWICQLAAIRSKERWREKEGERESERERWTTCSLKQLANDLQEFEKCTQQSQWAETRNRGWITTALFVWEICMSMSQIAQLNTQKFKQALVLWSTMDLWERFVVFLHVFLLLCQTQAPWHHAEILSRQLHRVTGRSTGSYEKKPFVW